MGMEIYIDELQLLKQFQSTLLNHNSGEKTTSELFSNPTLPGALKWYVSELQIRRGIEDNFKDNFSHF